MSSSGPFSGLPSVLRRRREQLKLTQRKLARAARMTCSQWSRVETGMQSPSVETLGRMIEALGWDLEDFARALRGLRPLDEGAAVLLSDEVARVVEVLDQRDLRGVGLLSFVVGTHVVLAIELPARTGQEPRNGVGPEVRREPLPF